MIGTFNATMEENTPLVDGSYLLEKFHGKGGWTYARIPELIQNKENPFGWVRVKGSIDGYSFTQIHLMPMGNEQLFLPVKAKIRKQIKKAEGDYVHVILYPDHSPVTVPPEIVECLRNEHPNVYKNFLGLTESEKKAYLDWVYEAKKEETKASRIVKMIERLEKNLSLYDPEVF